MMLWIDRCVWRAYQIANTTASRTANTAVLDAEARHAECVGEDTGVEVPVMLTTTTVSQ